MMSPKTHGPMISIAPKPAPAAAPACCAELIPSSPLVAVLIPAINHQAMRTLNTMNDHSKSLPKNSSDRIDKVAQTVEESSVFAQGKRLVERHPFLTGLLGPSIVRKLFGR